MQTEIPAWIVVSQPTYANLQTAIDNAAHLPNKPPVYLPSGIYNLGRNTVNVWEQVQLISDNQKNQVTSRLDYTGDKEALVLHSGASLRGIAVEVPRDATATHIVRTGVDSRGRDATELVIERCYFAAPANTTLIGLRGWDHQITACGLHGGRTAIDLSANCNNNRVQRCRITHNPSIIKDHPEPRIRIVEGGMVSIRDNSIEPSHIGISIRDASVVVEGNYIERAYSTFVRVEPDTDDAYPSVVRIRDNEMWDDSINYRLDGIQLHGGVVIVEGNRIGRTNKNESTKGGVAQAIVVGSNCKEAVIGKNQIHAYSSLAISPGAEERVYKVVQKHYK